MGAQPQWHSFYTESTYVDLCAKQADHAWPTSWLTRQANKNRRHCVATQARYAERTLRGGNQADSGRNVGKTIPEPAGDSPCTWDTWSSMFRAPQR